MKNKMSITQGYLLIFLMAFVISIAGATYAYFAVTKSNTTSISGDAAMINLNLSVRKILPLENSSNGYIVPQRSGTLANAMNGSCVDSNNNIVCQVYSVTIRNNSTASVMLDGKIYFFSDEQMQSNISTAMPNLKWKLVESFDEETISNSVLGNASINSASSGGGIFSDDLLLSSNQEGKFYLIVWVNETNSSQTDLNSTFYGKVSFIASNGSGVTASFVGY